MSEGCSVRHAEISDLREIYFVEINSFPYPYSLEYFITFLTLYPNYFLVVTCSNRVVGYVVGALNSDGSGHVISLAVDPKYRRRGLGALLLRSLERKFKESGIFRVFLEVSEWNKVAINLYKKLSYKVIGIRSHYYPDGSDAYVMFKEL